VPCKHLAAVFYLLAESFDDDPFAILALRGRDRQTLLENVRERRGEVPAGSTPPGPSASAGTGSGNGPQGEAQPEAPPYRALEGCLDGYFQLAAELPSLPVQAVAGVPADAMLDQLPPVGLTVRGRPLVELLRPAYHVFAEAGEG
jgi:uncharacterized Zn finger protein